MSKYKFVSINRIFSKLIRDVTSDFSESDVVEWCGEALEFIQATRSYEEAVAFIEVKNHQCKIPAGTHAIIQIARNNAWAGPKDDSLCPATLVTENTDTTSTTDIPVAIDCNGEPKNAFELAYYRPFFDLKWEYQFWMGTNTYRQKYTPVRLATNSFFNSVVCKEVLDGMEDVYKAAVDEYTIVTGDTLRFSFKEGSVAVALLRQVVDEETGYPMIPDNISYTTAITKYISLKMAEKAHFNGRQGAESLVNKLDRDWQWYCKQATNMDLMPQGEDEHQNLLDQRSYLLPQQNRYYGFFGKMNRPEGRRFNDPDARNSWHGYFRG